MQKVTTCISLHLTPCSCAISNISEEAALSACRTVELTRPQGLHPAVPQSCSNFDLQSQRSFRKNDTWLLIKTSGHVTLYIYIYQFWKCCQNQHITAFFMGKCRVSLFPFCRPMLRHAYDSAPPQPPRPPVLTTQCVIRKATLRAAYRTYNTVSKFSLKGNLLTESTLTVCITQGVSLSRHCAPYHRCTTFAFCSCGQNVKHVKTHFIYLKH